MRMCLNGSEMVACACCRKGAPSAHCVHTCGCQWLLLRSHGMGRAFSDSIALHRPCNLSIPAKPVQPQKSTCEAGSAGYKWLWRSGEFKTRLRGALRAFMSAAQLACLQHSFDCVCAGFSHCLHVLRSCKVVSQTYWLSPSSCTPLRGP